MGIDHWRAAIAVGIATALLLVAIVGLGLPPTPTRSPLVRGSTILQGAAGPAVDLQGGYLGVNVRADAGNLTESSVAHINATPARLLRWPGGGLGDRLATLADGAAGVIYNDNGSSSPATGSLANFVAACEAIHCLSIVALPGEIDDPDYAAQIVSYAEFTLGFHPTYWEIGNEPALWNHFGIPWANWTDRQNLSPSPSEYARVVQAYTVAVRAVDPSAQIVGLPGVGKGGSSDSAWIAATVALNGPNLSAIALHVYPGGSLSGNRSLSDWFASLNGSTGLADRVRTAQTAIGQACATCSIAVLVDEFGPATNVTSADGLRGGNLAAYLAAVVVQGMTLPITTLSYWAFQSGTYGSWFSAGGQPSASFELYSGILPYLGPFATSIGIHAPAPGLLGAQGGAHPGASGNVLLVNTNTSTDFWIDLSATYPDASAGTAWVWNGADSAPHTSPIGGPGAENWTLPAASLAIFSDLGPRVTFPLAAAGAAGGLEAHPHASPPPADPPESARVGPAAGILIAGRAREVGVGIDPSVGARRHREGSGTGERELPWQAQKVDEGRIPIAEGPALRRGRAS